MGGTAAGYLLDVTRLTSRLGRGALTGIDRVELAYLQHFLAQPVPVFGLLRTRLGFVLLGATGLGALNAHASSADLPPSGLLARFFGAGAAALRPHAIARRPHFALAHLLARLPQGTQYFNVGHSNLSHSVLAAIRSAHITSAVLIHDTIPLDHPHFARADAIAAFRAKIRAVALGADRVIHISHDARRKTEAQFARFGRVPAGVTAPNGITLARPTPSVSRPKPPYFVALGTVEPRKNHKLLLDIWQNMAPGTDTPHLLIVGNTGWADDAVFAQIAQLSARGTVTHLQGLDDGAVAYLLQGAAGLLFPSLAEGFGMPPIEAACHGIPAIVSDLPVLRETCAPFALYLDPNDINSWVETIDRLARAARVGHIKPQVISAPSWDDHFKVVLTLGD